MRFRSRAWGATGAARSGRCRGRVISLRSSIARVYRDARARADLLASASPVHGDLPVVPRDTAVRLLVARGRAVRGELLRPDAVSQHLLPQVFRAPQLP